MRRRNPWYWLLLVPMVVSLAVPFYDRVEPTLFGFPFYYWCQLAFVVFTLVVTMVVHLATRERREP
jgi:uncharacterized membrane protein